MEALLISLVKALVVMFGLLGGFAYTTLLERKLVGRIQLRYGPNRVGPFGLLQPMADGIKLLFKEEVIPSGANRSVYLLAPALSVISAVVAFAVIPVGSSITLFGREISLSLADLNIGVLFLLAVNSVGVYGIVLAGWSSNNKYSLLGGVRSSAQLISYELALGLGVVAAVMLAGSVRLRDIVAAQDIPFALLMPVGFLLYFIAGIAEVNRAPFDLPEAENELVAGYHTEYTGLKFAMFYMAEYINMITVSAVVTTLYLAGWRGPGPDGPHWFLLKVFLLLCVFVWVRATLPRFRYDTLMRFGWQVLLPLGIINLLVVATVVLLAG
ncbi:MAG: NADH-quinone oxidoreductase subunit NuoH [Chloroflexota bacterium]|nr:NADH-quinone oxidoreductase subunit NuoH [Chloroflexota bacterium]